MFTPPASPAPPRTRREESPLPSDSDEEGSQYLLVPQPLALRCTSAPPAEPKASRLAAEFSASVEAKQRTAKRTRWTILLVPLVLVLITASTRFIAHPAVLDVLAADHAPADWHSWSSTLTDWRPHKRHASPDPAPQTPSPTVSSPTPTSSQPLSPLPSASTTPGGSAGQSMPTIPSDAPALPTPFPQPLDSTFSRNFSTQGCLDFFQNMTQSASFRSCRPFSLLSVQSDAFLEAQQNLTALNALVWGTCNTSIDFDQCTANMNWFADALEDTCAEDLKDSNAVVTQTRDGLLAYELMRNVGCLADPTTNAYCYLEAVHNPNPADLYFYALPFGTALPPSAQPSCSGCTKSVMGLYAQHADLAALAEVYAGAAGVADKACGAGYVQVTAGAVASGALPVHRGAPGAAMSMLLGVMLLAMFGW